MTVLPITRMTLYKHGVGHFQRQQQFTGEEVQLVFHRDEMTDILKSLTVLDHSGGQVHSIDYDTPQSQKEKLAGCSIRLDEQYSLQNLLSSLRGKTVELVTLDGKREQGQMVGLDYAGDDDEIIRVSLLQTDSEAVVVFPLESLHSIQPLNAGAAADLRFFLETVAKQEDYRAITLRLSPGEHDLAVSYIAPAPTWRVSYRLVIDGGSENDVGEHDVLLQGWGIFDNRLEEDLQNIQLTLTAGMPLSFIYDLYTPHTPERPVVEPEDRTTAGPMEFSTGSPPAAEYAAFADMEDETPSRSRKMAAPRAMPSAAPPPSPRQMAESAPTVAEGKALGELFQYNISTPVTVGRGQSAMVPIVGQLIRARKELIYNRQQYAKHPVATLRFNNKTGLTLETGPVTLQEDGAYIGEAMLPFTAQDAETIVAYAVELGVHVEVSSENTYQMNGLTIRDRYLIREMYQINTTTYQLDNRGGNEKVVLVDHPRSDFTPFEMVEPSETTLHHRRYRVAAPGRKLTAFVVQERKQIHRQQELQRYTTKQLQEFLENRFLDKATFDALDEVLTAWRKIEAHQAELKQLDKLRQKVYQEQAQMQKNMGVLGNSGEEGRLRNRYVRQMNQGEDQLREWDQRQRELEDTMAAIETQIEGMLAAMNKKSA